MKEFECKDAGFKNCNWKATGNSEDEILRLAAEHGKEKHGLTQMTDDLKSKVRSLIHESKAA